MLMAAFACPALAQTATPGLRIVPTGYCQFTASGTAVTLSACVRASFTGTGSGTNLTVSAVAGVIKPGDGVAGTGVPAGTTIISQVSGTTGGAGVYKTSAATTASSASLTSGGIPTGSTLAVVSIETANVRWRDDGAAPTASVGMPISAGAAPYTFMSIGRLSNLQFIAQSGSPVVNVAFYTSP